MPPDDEVDLQRIYDELMAGAAERRSRGECPNCGQRIDVEAFRDMESAAEYVKSGLCQTCQDMAFDLVDATDDQLASELTDLLEQGDYVVLDAGLGERMFLTFAGTQKLLDHFRTVGFPELPGLGDLGDLVDAVDAEERQVLATAAIAGLACLWPRRCLVCGCTDDRACVGHGILKRCYWIGDQLCSACAPNIEGETPIIWQRYQ